MTIKTCIACSSEYDSENVTIPSPIPDLMCAHCGTQLSQAQVDSLTQAQVDSLPVPDEMVVEQPEPTP